MWGYLSLIIILLCLESGRKRWQGLFLRLDLTTLCLVAQLCLTLCNPTDSSPPGSPVHGVLQAKILEWVTISYSRWSSSPRDWTRVPCIVDRFLTVWATMEAYQIDSNMETAQHVDRIKLILSLHEILVTKWVYLLEDLLIWRLFLIKAYNTFPLRINF